MDTGNGLPMRFTCHCQRLRGCVRIGIAIRSGRAIDPAATSDQTRMRTPIVTIQADLRLRSGTSAFTSSEICNAHVNCAKSVFVRSEQDAPEGMMTMTRVLVVEDSPDIARLVQRSLLLEGYEVDVASDGRGALAVVRDSPPDLIVLDLMLPDIDGMEICRRVRAMEAAYEQPPVPVLMLTALDAVPDRVSGLDAGADDYVPKPFAITELMARVRSLLRRSRAPEMRSKQRE